ncbi:MAG: hypothetical protein ABSB42_18810 [Tepidisphaeraceae bacterium]
MRKKLLATIIVLLTVGFAPLSALADDQSKSYDGRLDDYGNKSVTLDGGAALSYFVWIGLGLVGLLVMFKDAKRSHLD